MVKLELSLDDPGMIGLESWARGAGELAVIDTSVLLPGIYPAIRKQHRNWIDEIKYDLSVEKMIRDYAHQNQSTIPVIVETVQSELVDTVHPSSRLATNSWFRRMESNPNAFYVKLDGHGKAPEDVVADFKKYGKKETRHRTHDNDLDILGTAYQLAQKADIDVTVVSDDQDFNCIVRDDLKKYKSRHGHYVHLRRPDQFSKEHQLSPAIRRLQSLRATETIPLDKVRRRPYTNKTEVIRPSE